MLARYDTLLTTNIVNGKWLDHYIGCTVKSVLVQCDSVCF